MKGVTLQRFDVLSRAVRGRKIMVAGDIIADGYIYGATERVSREAPVLILRWTGEEIRPGGAGNAANNVVTLGGEVYPLGVIGDDEPGRSLFESMLKAGFRTDGIIVEKGGATPLKTRIMAGGKNVCKQQVIRIDRVRNAPLGPETIRKAIRRFEELLPVMDGIIISDYGLGLFDKEFVRATARLLAKREKVSVVDSRHNLLLFKKASIATPNEGEAQEASGVMIDSEESLEKAARLILKKTKNEALLITRGSKGMALFTDDGGVLKLGIVGSDDVTDVTGAGDTVAAAVCLFRVAGASWHETCVIANHAGASKVMKRGTQPVFLEEIRSSIERTSRL